MSDSEWLQDVYLQTYTDLTRFVIRRLHLPDRAEDVVADAFAVAWQRLGDLPDDLDEARAWPGGACSNLSCRIDHEQCDGRAALRVGGTQYVATGRVGADVAAVSFDAGGAYVEATLRDGFFAAWWPERRPKTLLGKLTEHGPPNPEVKVTLKDDTTRVQRIQDFDVSPS